MVLRVWRQKEGIKRIYEAGVQFFAGRKQFDHFPFNRSVRNFGPKLLDSTLFVIATVKRFG
ncbi:MAG: hypothetical protein BGO54_22350 [Sphingobacteriales bacterium 46-32]|nr:MAG: hypothetical protein BGO54_22350 [Sphingobacteriales bacterium 46-32]